MRKNFSISFVLYFSLLVAASNLVSAQGVVQGIQVVNMNDPPLVVVIKSVVEQLPEIQNPPPVDDEFDGPPIGGADSPPDLPPTLRDPTHTGMVQISTDRLVNAFRVRLHDFPRGGYKLMYNDIVRGPGVGNVPWEGLPLVRGMLKDANGVPTNKLPNTLDGALSFNGLFNPIAAGDNVPIEFPNGEYTKIYRYLVHPTWRLNQDPVYIGSVQFKFHNSSDRRRPWKLEMFNFVAGGYDNNMNGAVPAYSAGFITFLAVPNIAAFFGPGYYKVAPNRRSVTIKLRFTDGDEQPTEHEIVLPYDVLGEA
ncbi:MAG: hypothetical protein AAF394_08180, partial [Planctomycetota bacterium]